ncbi:class I SAM-dependent methyltransferase [Ascidiimonas sp. W6]|uniref:class I SAM-dependent methyltransferase n=1 Tax=Ascidiimonas meishanensis TaxID=3128903 RepID=UPI0030EE58BD
MKCKDHSVSGEEFELVYDAVFDMLKTDPVPDNLEAYYNSEAYISHTDGKRTLFEKVYQWVKNYTLANKLSYLEKHHHSKGRLLDIGAGTGDFLVEAKTSGWEVSGIEPNEDARARAENKGIQLNPDLDDLIENKFHAITMWHVLEHIQDLDKQIESLRKVLVSNGTLFVAVPNFKSYDALHYKQYWAAYDVPRHLWHFSQTSIQKIFEKHEMKVVEIIPMKFDAYYVSLLSEKYKTGKMNVMKAFFTGFVSNWKGNKTKQYSSLIYVIKNT